MPSQGGDQHYPIIYVRGYAGNQSAIEEAVADPYNGFNVGSTRIRQAWTGRIDRHYFESPLVRLMKEHGYCDVYSDGRDLPDEIAVPARPIVIYRYYDPASRDMGTGEQSEIEDYARGLGELIVRLRDRMCSDAASKAAFRVYLLAHSMGGLICRSFLQNDGLVDVADGARFAEARQAVDKVFTYATPHNGIDLSIIGNVPGFFTRDNADNFNRQRMRQFLGLKPAADTDDVASLNGCFDPDRFFTLVGTNHRDYEVGGAIVRAVVGPMSDGLVRIGNATVYGPWPGDQPVNMHCPRGFINRAHSGHYGIVNSEEGYQNLVRFLFGDARVDGVLEVNSLTLPPDVAKKMQEGKAIKASYHFEVVVRVRGATWDLHRRTVADGSAMFRTFDEMLRPRAAGLTSPRYPHLFSTFLAGALRVNKQRKGLGFSIDLGVLVPQYEIDGLLWFDNHYEGGYLYRDKINFEAIPDDAAPGGWRLRYGFDSRTPNRATTDARPIQAPDCKSVQFRVPVQQSSDPGIDAELVLTARPWG